MIEELDVVKIKRNLKIEDLEGEEIVLAAGTTGTVMVAKNGISECIIEFGPIENASMVPVDKRYLQLIWSYRKECSKKPTKKNASK